MNDLNDLPHDPFQGKKTGVGWLVSYTLRKH